MVRRHPEYDIASIPPLSRHKFLFSWTTGRLVRAKDDALVLTISPARSPGLFFDTTYEVSDASGVPVGALVPSGADWIIRHASGDRDVRVLRDDSRFNLARYIASVEDRELCRFTWTVGASVYSAEMQIEFVSEADSALRLLAVALAPVLELRSRLRHERSLPA